MENNKFQEIVLINCYVDKYISILFKTPPNNEHGNSFVFGYFELIGGDGARQFMKKRSLSSAFYSENLFLINKKIGCGLR
jgi:hypothetical protein